MRWVYLLLAIVLFNLGIVAVEKIDNPGGIGYTEQALKHNEKLLQAVSACVRAYHEDSGRYPNNGEGLRPIMATIDDGRADETGFIKDRLALHELRWCRLTKNTVYSVWGEPLIYENRSGLPNAKFADSGVNSDKRHVWSVQVDKDVYVWSLGAQKAYLRYMKWRPWLALFRIAVIVLPLFLVVLFARASVLKLQTERTLFSRIGTYVWSLVSGIVLLLTSNLVFQMMQPTCYRMGFSNYRPTPELTKSYRQLAAKYHKRGVISDKAYGCLLDALKE